MILFIRSPQDIPQEVPVLKDEEFHTLGTLRFYWGSPSKIMETEWSKKDWSENHNTEGCIQNDSQRFGLKNCRLCFLHIENYCFEVFCFQLIWWYMHVHGIQMHSMQCIEHHSKFVHIYKYIRISVFLFRIVQKLFSV